MSTELNNIDLTPNQRKAVAELLKRYIPDTEVWAYGSRVKFTSTLKSDLDLVAFATPEQKRAISNLKEAFEESNLPFRVDLFIWNKVPEQFHKNIEAERVVLQNAAEKRVMGSEWNEYSLGEIAKNISRPFNFSGRESVVFVNTGDVLKGDFLHANHSNPKGLPGQAKKRIIEGDILFREIRPANGRYAEVTFDSDDYVVSTKFMVIRLTSKEVYQPFFLIQLTSEQTLFEFQRIAESRSGTFPQITFDAISYYPFTFPPLPEQKAIAHILGSLDDKIELNRRMNATLEGMAQALFKSWFVDFDPVIDNALAAGNPIPEELTERAQVRSQALANGTANREAANQFPAAFQLTEKICWIPEGWKTVTLNQAIQINPSVKLSKGTVALFADMKALPTDDYSIDGVIEKAYSGGAKFQNDDVLIARITPCLENGKTGIVDFLSSPTDVGFGSTEFIVLRGKGELRFPYVACLAREENFRLHCIQSMVGSSGRQRVQNSCFDSFRIACPTDLTVLKKFSEITQPMFQKTIEQAKESRTLTNLRDALLPKLISGAIRIPDVEKLTEEALA